MENKSRKNNYKRRVPEIPTKAYRIDLSKILSEGFLYDDIFCYATSRNEAKYKLLEKIRYDGMQLLYSSDEITYMNIPVIRYKEADLLPFEGNYITQREIDILLMKRERLNNFDAILNDASVSHCYIRKHGSYYRPDACGYTIMRAIAGVYTKEEAVSHGKSCDDLHIIPINTSEHNQMILDEIKDLQSRLIPDGK